MALRFSEETISTWAKGPSTTESEKAENAERAIRKALRYDAKFAEMDFSVFTQGSYRGRTNVRMDSDVDVCVRFNGSFFPDYPSGTTKEQFGHVDGHFPFADFKNMVGRALSAYFGESSVKRGTKAFDIHANTYRIDADVIPTFEHRRYTSVESGAYLSGVAFIPDGGNLIINWPDQTYANGVTRNDATGRCYKRMIRILKRLRNHMLAGGMRENFDAQSFLLESLVWNVPTEAFRHDRYTDDLRYVLATLWNATRDEKDSAEWGEVNELKYLFRYYQPWTLASAHAFIDAAWNYVGFE